MDTQGKRQIPGHLGLDHVQNGEPAAAPCKCSRGGVADGEKQWRVAREHSNAAPAHGPSAMSHLLQAGRDAAHPTASLARVSVRADLSALMQSHASRLRLGAAKHARVLPRSCTHEKGYLSLHPTPPPPESRTCAHTSPWQNNYTTSSASARLSAVRWAHNLRSRSSWPTLH